MTSFMRRLFQSFLKQRPDYKGNDMHGNEYYETLTRGGKLRRSVKVQRSLDPVEYSQHTIPPQWDRWLRYLRETPPTEEEERQRIIYDEKMKQKVKDLELKQEEERSKLQEEEPKIALDKKERGNTFEPSPWKPK